MAMWARTAAGTNLAFLKGFGKALKSWKDIIQQSILRKAAPKPKGLDADVPHAREKCFVYQPTLQIRPNEKLQTRIFRSMFARSINASLMRTVRSRAAAEISSTNSGMRNFRRIPILSLIGITMGVDLENLIEGNSEKVMSDMRNMFQDYGWQSEPLANAPVGLDDLEIIHNSIANGCEGAVYKAKIKTHNEQPETTEISQSSNSDEDFDLAVKAVFNYGAESNAGHIMRELHREMVPLNARACENTSASCVSDLGRLPPHPNIVDMPGIFVDDVLVTEEGLKNFPAAMPHTLNPETCYGRNKTLYLVMRRRTTHLGDYLSSHDVSMATRCHILAQTLEGIAHLVNHGIAHRDLKTNNILVAVPKAAEGAPKIEICDFGCCLAEENRSLRVQFPSRDLFIGGNSWLMAPEIATAQPGPNTVLDFSKADAWAVGAMAYEILGAENPFYPSKTKNSRKQLSSVTYCMEDLPELPADVPSAVRKLVKALLVRDPRKRPSASVAATAMHMVVMETGQPRAKTGQKQQKRKITTASRTYTKPQVLHAYKEREMFQRVLVQSLSLLCKLTFGSQDHTTWDVESVTKFLFLSRLNYHDFKLALHFF